MKLQISVLVLSICFVLAGTAYGQTGTIDGALNIVTRVAYDGMEFEVELDYDSEVAGGRGHYWKFKSIKPVELTNTLGMAFRLIPVGSFVMGSPVDEPGREGDEPQHLVKLTEPFYMQTTEVTQAQWSIVMGGNPSEFSTCGPACPVENVSWEDAQAFIIALNDLDIGTYRLPTEAEWEYAARAQSTTAFGNGPIKETGDGDDPILDAMGWYYYNSRVNTHQVGQKQPNAWGLYDMHGNVWEWCQDWYGAYPLPREIGKKVLPVTDPTGPSIGSKRVVRGGGFFAEARHCRSAGRHDLRPRDTYESVGFRVVREN